MHISFKYCARVALGLAAVITSVTQLHGATAVTNVVANNTMVGYAFVGGGFAFRANTDIIVNSLGYTNSDYANYTVQLYDANGVSLASTTMAAGGSLAYGYLFQPITPVTIKAGTTNYVIAVDGDGMWIGTSDYNASGPSIEVRSSPEVTWLGSVAWFDPTTLYDSYWRGPNFGFEPAPVTPPARPTLSIWLSSPTTVSLAWPTNFPSAVLQGSAEPVGETMTNVAGVPVIIGTNKVLRLPMEAGRAFFRLAN